MYSSMWHFMRQCIQLLSHMSHMNFTGTADANRGPTPQTPNSNTKATSNKPLFRAILKKLSLNVPRIFLPKNYYALYFSAKLKHVGKSLSFFLFFLFALGRETGKSPVVAHVEMRIGEHLEESTNTRTHFRKDTRKAGISS